MFARLIAEFADIDLQNINAGGTQFRSAEFFVKIDGRIRQRRLPFSRDLNCRCLHILDQNLFGIFVRVEPSSPSRQNQPETESIRKKLNSVY
jgi:hypothetical protein